MSTTGCFTLTSTPICSKLPMAVLLGHSFACHAQIPPSSLWGETQDMARFTQALEAICLGPAMAARTGPILARRIVAQTVRLTWLYIPWLIIFFFYPRFST